MPHFEIERAQNLQAARADNVVRVSVPAEVHFSLDKINRLQKDILKLLGCPNCHSGWDIRFRLQREFLVDEKLNVHAVGPAGTLRE